MPRRRDAVSNATARSDRASGTSTAVAGVGGARRLRGRRGVRARRRAMRQPSGGQITNS